MIDLQKIIESWYPNVGDLVNIKYEKSVPKFIYRDCLVLNIKECDKKYPQQTFNNPEYVYDVLYDNKIKTFRETHVKFENIKRIKSNDKTKQ
jgi:hypothetical protein